jgi:hypothetical protein
MRYGISAVTLHPTAAYSDYIRHNKITEILLNIYFKSAFNKEKRSTYVDLFSLEGPVGLEPTTPCLKGRCSNQLSYGPINMLCVYNDLFLNYQLFCSNNSKKCTTNRGGLSMLRLLLKHMCWLSKKQIDHRKNHTNTNNKFFIMY